METSIPEAFVGIKMTNNDLAPTYCREDILLKRMDEIEYIGTCVGVLAE